MLEERVEGHLLDEGLYGKFIIYSLKHPLLSLTALVVVEGEVGLYVPVVGEAAFPLQIANYVVPAHLVV